MNNDIDPLWVQFTVLLHHYCNMMKCSQLDKKKLKQLKLELLLMVAHVALGLRMKYSTSPSDLDHFFHYTCKWKKMCCHFSPTYLNKIITSYSYLPHSNKCYKVQSTQSGWLPTWSAIPTQVNSTRTTICSCCKMWANLANNDCTMSHKWRLGLKSH